MIYADWSNKKGWFLYDSETDNTEFINKNDWNEFKLNIPVLYVETGCPEAYLYGMNEIYIINSKSVKDFREKNNFKKSDEEDPKTLYLYCQETNDVGNLFIPKLELEQVIREKVKVLITLRRAYNQLENLSKSIEQEFNFEANKNKPILTYINKSKQEIETQLSTMPIIQKYKIGLETYFKTESLGFSEITIAKILTYIGNPNKYHNKGRNLGKALCKKFKTIPDSAYLSCEKCIDHYPCKSCRNKYNRSLKTEFYNIIRMGQNNNTLIGNLYQQYYKNYIKKHPEKIKIEKTFNDTGKLQSKKVTKFNKEHFNKLIIRKIVTKILFAWVQIDINWDEEIFKIKHEKQIKFL